MWEVWCQWIWKRFMRIYWIDGQNTQHEQKEMMLMLMLIRIRVILSSRRLDPIMDLQNVRCNFISLVCIFSLCVWF